MLPSYWIYRG
jgi:hypothetical protein